MIMAGQTKAQDRKETDHSPSYICCCCSCCGVSRSTATHIRYNLFLLATFIICLVALVPNVREKLDHLLPFCRTHFGTQICNNIAGYSAVYRISFAMGLFSFLFSVLLMGVQTVDDQRAQLHYGYWIVKALLISGLVVCSTFIPGLNGNFNRVWMYFGLAGGFLFTLVQLVILIDFSSSLSSTMDGPSTRNKAGTCWNVLLWLGTAVLYGVSLTAVACFYVIFTNRKKKKCFSNMFFISFIVFHCAVVSIISMIPRVQRVQPGTGLLQTAVVTTYTTYITWTALSHEPDDWCNPRGYLISGYNETSRLTMQSILASIIGFCTLVYAGSRPIHSSSRWRKWFPCFGNENFTRTYSSSQTETASKEGSTFNYSFFHFVMFLASLYFMMALTNWYSPYQTSQGVQLTRSWPAVWVKMGSSSACLWLYTWSLLAPLTRELIDKDTGNAREEKETLELKQTRLPHKQDSEKFTSPKAFSSPKVLAETKEEYSSRVGERLQDGELHNTNKPCKNNEGNLQPNCQFPANKNTADLGTKQPLSEADKEMFRLQEKILKIQSKIAKLQNKVAVLQGLDV